MSVLRVFHYVMRVIILRPSVHGASLSISRSEPTSVEDLKRKTEDVKSQMASNLQEVQRREDNVEQVAAASREYGREVRGVIFELNTVNIVCKAKNNHGSKTRFLR